MLLLVEMRMEEIVMILFALWRDSFIIISTIQLFLCEYLSVDSIQRIWIKRKTVDCEKKKKKEETNNTQIHFKQKATK